MGPAPRRPAGAGRGGLPARPRRRPAGAPQRGGLPGPHRRRCAAPHQRARRRRRAGRPGGVGAPPHR